MARNSRRSNPEHRMPVALGSHVLAALDRGRAFAVDTGWRSSSRRVVGPRRGCRPSPTSRGTPAATVRDTGSMVLSAGRGWFRHPRRGLALLVGRVFLTDTLKRLTIGLHVQKTAGLAVPLYPSNRSLDLRTVADSTPAGSPCRCSLPFLNHLLSFLIRSTFRGGSFLAVRLHGDRP
jgi:hypothetical protein